MANKNDERILKLRNQIKAKKEKIGKIGRFAPVTNCSLELDGIRYNLNVLNKEQLIQLLVKIHSYILSAGDLGMNGVVFSGYTLEEWASDVKSKLDILFKKDEERELTIMETKLEKMLSDEKQVELELDELESLLED